MHVKLILANMFQPDLRYKHVYLDSFMEIFRVEIELEVLLHILKVHYSQHLIIYWTSSKNAPYSNNN